MWAVVAGGFTDDIAQRMLGHAVGPQVSRAYQRSDFFDQKRAVLEAWVRYVTRAHTADRWPFSELPTIDGLGQRGCSTSIIIRCSPFVPRVSEEQFCRLDALAFAGG